MPAHWTPSDWAQPAWDTPCRTHDWHGYISAEVRAMWQTFTDPQKQALARQAQDAADLEEWD